MTKAWDAEETHIMRLYSYAPWMKQAHRRLVETCHRRVSTTTHAIPHPI